MTDRLKGLVVAFQSDIREDDAEAIISAIRQLRGVAGVSTSVADTNDWMNRQQIKMDLSRKLWAALESEGT